MEVGIPAVVRSHRCAVRRMACRCCAGERSQGLRRNGAARVLAGLMMASPRSIVIACCLIIGAGRPLCSTTVADDAATVLFAQYASGRFDEASRGLAALRDWA